MPELAGLRVTAAAVTVPARMRRRGAAFCAVELRSDGPARAGNLGVRRPAAWVRSRRRDGGAHS